jgi:hypothetical protein
LHNTGLFLWKNRSLRSFSVNGHDSVRVARMDDPLHPESTAYHEAGHIVVAAAQGMRLFSCGIQVDSHGKGISYYDYRKPQPIRCEFDEHGRRTIVSLFAGLIAQQKFHPTCSTASASKDQEIIDQLLPQMYLDGTPQSENRLSEAKLKLEKESRGLVEQHWEAIQALAKFLWGRPDTPRIANEPEKSWTDSPTSKSVDGAGITRILGKHGISVSIEEAEVGGTDER